MPFNQSSYIKVFPSNQWVGPDLTTQLKAFKNIFGKREYAGTSINFFLFPKVFAEPFKTENCKI